MNFIDISEFKKEEGNLIVRLKSGSVVSCIYREGDFWRDNSPDDSSPQFTVQCKPLYFLEGSFEKKTFPESGQKQLDRLYKQEVEKIAKSAVDDIATILSLVGGCEFEDEIKKYRDDAYKSIEDETGKIA